MSVFSPTLRAVPALILIAVALSACGGGGGASAPTQTPPVVVPPVPVVPVVTAQPDTVVAALNTSTTLAILANDSVTAGGTLKLVSNTVPAHGSATISGDTIIYVPAIGYFGKDSFSYTVKDIGSGTATSTADVAVTVNANLTLSGNTVDVPANATLTIAIGAKTVAASTDANGNYSVPVALDTPASMISITAQGTGDKAFIKLISMVGDSQLAVNAAGTGLVATAATLPGLQVSALSTALYTNALYRNNATVPATQAQLNSALDQIRGNELGQTANMLRSLTGKAGAAPLRTLPAGVADTLALVLDTGAYAQFVKRIPEQAQFDEELVLSSDARLGSVPSVVPAASTSLNFFLNNGCCALAATEIVLNSDGTGSFSRDRIRTPGLWRKDAALTMTLTTPFVRKDTKQLPNSMYANVQYITREVAVRQLSGGAERGFAILMSSGTLHYVNGEVPDAPFSSGEILAFANWDNLTVPADLSSAVLDGVPDLTTPVTANQDITPLSVFLAPGGDANTANYPGLVMSWRQQNGKLVLDFTSPHSLTMGRFRINANGEEHWLVRASYGGDYSVYEAMIVRPQAGVAFTDANAVQRWFSSPLSNAITSLNEVDVLASHASRYQTENLDGTFTISANTSWRVEDGILAMRDYRTSSGSIVAVCPTGQTCTTNTTRFWRMLRNDGTSIVVLDYYYITPTNVRKRLLRYGHN